MKLEKSSPIDKLTSIYKLKKSVIPSIIKPQLCTLVDTPPMGNQWLHEMKFDGYRLICIIKNQVTLLTRSGQDWTHRFKSIADRIAKLKLKETILDGEIVVLDKNGLPHFQMLQNVLNNTENGHLVYYIFDIIYYNGHNLSALNLIQRKKILKSILSTNDLTLRYSTFIQGEGNAVYKNACKLGFEGIISKNIESSYIQKRSKTWLKIKCSQRQEFVIVGMTQPKGQRGGFGALLLGYYSNHKLTYCGRVGTGFTQKLLTELYEKISQQKISYCPLADPLKVIDLLFWVKPIFLVEVEFTEWTSDGILRHPSFKGIRMDKKATQVKKEKAVSILDYHLTHPERLVYPYKKITKKEVAEYYKAIHPFILPHLINRPLAIVRCPKGVNDPCFFQKHMNMDEYKNIHSHDKYIYIQNAQGLMELAQMGMLELHLWGVHRDYIEKPDLITFDLDPAPDVPWKKVVDTAFLLKEELEHLNLQSFVKLTGGKGLHVVIPITRRYKWEKIESFTKTMAHYFVLNYPKDYTDVMSKSKRVGKIFIDYLRNKPGASSIAPYSTRANKEATLAWPLRWNELSVKIKPTDYAIDTIANKINKWRDPWPDFFTIKQTLPKM